MTEEELAEWFRSNGFTVKVSEGYWLEGPEVLPVSGMIGLRGSYYASDAEWILCLDHRDCYDKPQKCPIRSTERESLEAGYLERLRKTIHFLASNEGLELSNSYGYLDKPIWPPVALAPVETT